MPRTALPWILLACFAGAACRRATVPATDAGPRDGRAAMTRPGGLDGSTEPEPFGPPNPWGDGSLPRSSATGPEVDQTQASMTALRASIGFWRVVRSQHDRCPTLDDLAHTPGAAFDPATMRLDAWGEPYEIECQGARVRVRSLGPDRTRDTHDDLWAQ